MRAKYRTEREWMEAFTQEQAAKTAAAPPLGRKVVKPGALRHTPPRPIRVKR